MPALLENPRSFPKTHVPEIFSVRAITPGGIAVLRENTLAKTGNADMGALDPRTCFVKGTLVRTPSGFKEIQDIRPGDEVLAWSEESGELTISRVQQTFVRTTDAIYKVAYEDGTVIETTWSHPFYVAGQGWVQGKDLRAGMRSPTATAIAMHNESVAMSGGYRLPVQTVAFHGGARANNVSAATVSLGADLPGAVDIASVEVLPGTETVYNFAVEEEHNYFVSTGSVLVHNRSYNKTCDSNGMCSEILTAGNVPAPAAEQPGRSQPDEAKAADSFWDVAQGVFEATLGDGGVLEKTINLLTGQTLGSRSLWMSDADLEREARTNPGFFDQAIARASTLPAREILKFMHNPIAGLFSLATHLPVTAIQTAWGLTGAPLLTLGGMGWDAVFGGGHDLSDSFEVPIDRSKTGLAFVLEQMKTLPLISGFFSEPTADTNYMVRNLLRSRLKLTDNSQITDEQVADVLRQETHPVAGILRTLRNLPVVSKVYNWIAGQNPFDAEADRFLDNKEQQIRNVDAIRLHDGEPKDRIAFVTRDPLTGDTKAYNATQIFDNPELAAYFLQDRPNLLIHGKNSDLGGNSFNLDAMADAKGGTLSLFRAGFEGDHQQAVDLNQQLNAVVGMRNKAAAGMQDLAAKEAFLAQIKATPGFNIAAHSMANPVLAHLMAGFLDEKDTSKMAEYPDRANNALLNNGRPRYVRGTEFNLSGIGPAFGSQVANTMQGPWAGLLRAFDPLGADADSTRDLMEQNYDLIIDNPDHPYHGRYMQALKQYSSVHLGSSSRLYGAGLAFDTMFDQGRTQSVCGADLLVECGRIKDIYTKAGMGSIVHVAPVTHGDQIWDRNYLMPHREPLTDGQGKVMMDAQGNPQTIPINRLSSWSPRTSLIAKRL